MSTTSVVPQSVSPQLQVLQNEDLLRLILSWFDYSGFTPHRIQRPTAVSLLSVCFTCRSFFNPATDFLWRYMVSLTPLFNTLPGFNGDGHDDTNFMLHGAIEPIHLERFRFYARKVQALSIYSWRDSSLPIDFIFRLLSATDQPLFPALKTITFRTPHQNENFNPIFLAGGSNLRKIVIDEIFLQNGSQVSSLLLHLSSKAPGIQEVDLSGNLSHELLGSLKTMRDLRVVSLTFQQFREDVGSKSGYAMTTTFGPDLLDLPHLRRLYLHVETGPGLCVTTSRDGREVQATHPPGFRELQTLDLDSTARDILNVLHFIHYEAPKLRVVSCCAESAWATPAIRQECIAEMCRIGRNVTSFRFSFGEAWAEPSDVDYLNLNILRPFIQCRQLSSLNLSNMVFPTNDDQICEVVESGAWQNLCDLQLPSSRSSLSAPSMASLRILAQHCPRLTNLSIPIDLSLCKASDVQQERSHPRTLPPCQLKTLNIMIVKSNFRYQLYPQGVDLAIEVARFLEHYFPHLRDNGPRECLTFRNSNTSPESSLWECIVKKSLKEYTSFRAEMLAEMGPGISITT